MQHRFALAAATLAALVLAAPAGAADPPHSVTAIASSTVQVPQNTAKNDAAIRAAVAAARDKAAPDAIANATIEAQKLAAAAGWTLGAMTSVAELPPSPFGPFSTYGQDGTFGPGKYCGTIRTPIYRKGKNGRRIFTRHFRSHHGCRIPGQVTATLSATFAAS